MLQGELVRISTKVGTNQRGSGANNILQKLLECRKSDAKMPFLD